MTNKQQNLREKNSIGEGRSVQLGNRHKGLLEHRFDRPLVSRPTAKLEPRPSGSREDLSRVSVVGGALQNNEIAEPSWRAQDEDASSEEEGGPELIADFCSDAPWIGNGRWYSSLNDVQSEMRICGLTGPDGFYRLRMPVRGDLWVQGFAREFSPKIAVMTGTCMAEPTFLCLQDTGGYLLSLSAGTEIIIGVTASWEDLESGDGGEGDGAEGDEANDEFGYSVGLRKKSEDETTGTDGEDLRDPLEFYLDLSLRRILSEGQVCRPLALGRCESGTHCLSESEYSQLFDRPISSNGLSKSESWKCRSIPGETCELAQDILVDGPESIEVDPRNNYHDDHDHSCGGLRMRDRVLRLRFSTKLREELEKAPLDSVPVLRIWSDQPGVGLAAREPGCLSEAERQCASYGSNGAEIELNDLREMIARDAKPFVFLEYAAAPLGPQQPFMLHWALVDASTI